MLDYVIIGAGPAGCACALMLAEAGKKVCILEKNPAGCRKVCGDGLNSVCVRFLRECGFPMEQLEKAGALKIERYYQYHGGIPSCTLLKDEGKEVLALPRDRLDLVFQNYVQDRYQVPVYYGKSGRNIESIRTGYRVCGMEAKHVIVAAGAQATVCLDRKVILAPSHERPAGISMIVQAGECKTPYFLFDYAPEYAGTYGWIFCVGPGEYNVGLWIRENREHLKEEFERFKSTRVNEWLGDYTIIRPQRGAWMGIGEPVLSPVPGILFVGDAANSSNASDGEGISSAIKDAFRTLRRGNDGS